jgi:outer membrane immunogenic protein
MMKKRLLVGALLIAASGPAFAADLSKPAPVYTKAPPPMIYNWSGFYIGVNGGGAWGRSSFAFPATGTTMGDFNTSGGLIGGTVGFNWQSGPVVFGVEGDGDWANIKGTGSDTVQCPAPITCSTTDSWLATARGRLGFAANEWLFYGTGGGAFGDVKMANSGLPGQSVTRSGWTAGAGIEYGVTPNVSFKVEYLHVDLGTANCSLGNCAVGDTANVAFRAEVIRAGLNWRFGWGGPVVARY